MLTSAIAQICARSRARACVGGKNRIAEKFCASESEHMRHPRCTRGRLVHNVLIHHKKEDCRRSVLGAISVPGSTRIGSPMARVFQSLITRANSQLIPCRADKAKLSQWPRRRVDLDGCEIQSFFAIRSCVIASR